MVNFRKIEEGEPLIFRDRRNNEVYTEHVKFVGFAETGHPVVEFENGKRLMVLPEQLSYPHEEEFVNIRIYRTDRDRLTTTMKYGETMADVVHALIEQAREGSDSSDSLRDEADLTDADLVGADLSYADLSDADLEGADLRWANLEGANLEMANLEGANLEMANLEGANLVGANLRETKLVGAVLEGANLRESNLEGAKLRWADLRETKLRDADLTDADLDYAAWPLWCGSLGAKADRRLAAQLAYHFCRINFGDDELCKGIQEALVPLANEFHRVGEFGIPPIEERGA